MDEEDLDVFQEDGGIIPTTSEAERKDSNAKNRSAEEVFLFMRKDFRVSRNIRAQWYFEHLNTLVGIQKNEAIRNDQEITVVGLVPQNAESLETSQEKLLLTSKTVVTYFSKIYRLIFVLDFSPSCFVSDESGCVLYTELINNMVKCLKNVTKKFRFPGSNELFVPKFYVSVCVFTPFLCFAGDNVLVQGLLLSESNVEEAIDFIVKKLYAYINELCNFMQPLMKRWNAKRRRFLKIADPDRIINEESIDPNALDTDRGFIQPDWALIFMLRMGLMSVQMLPENTQSNIVVITDGVCGIPDSNALQQVLAQLRSYTVSCSFIQLQQPTLSGPVLGHVCFPELFKFISMATFGTFLLSTDLNEPCPELKMNKFHRAFLAWSFQRALSKEENNGIINENFTLIRAKRSITYETSLNKLLYVRLREGYTIKNVEIKKRDNQDMIHVRLSLPWKPQFFIEYDILAPWKISTQKRCKISVDIYVNGPILAVQESLNDRTQNSLTLSILSSSSLIIRMDMFNTDSHYYNVPKEAQNQPLFTFIENNPKPLVIPKGLEKTQFLSFWEPLCTLDEGIWQKWVHTHTIRLILAHDQPLPASLFALNQPRNRFIDVTAENAMRILHELLKKNASFTLVQNHSYVTLIYEDDEKIPKYFYLIRCTPEVPYVTMKIAFLGGVSGVKRINIVNDLRKKLTDLTATREKVFVVSKEPEDVAEESKSPKSAYRTTMTTEKLLVVVRKPMERILVRYKKIPRTLEQIVRLEPPDNKMEIREMILHNAIAKYLCCRRMIWQLMKPFPKFSFYPDTAEFILETILRRRMNQGFHIAYSKNGIVNLTRQLENLDDERLPRTEQYVIFPPRRLSDIEREEMMLRRAYRRDPLPDLIPNSKKTSLISRRDDISMYSDTTGYRATGQRSENDNIVQFVTEVWMEPEGQIKKAKFVTEYSSGSSSDETPVVEERRFSSNLLQEDDVIIRTLFTLDQLLRVCDTKSNDELPLNLNHLYPPPNAFNQISNEVARQSNMFDLKMLLKNASQRELMLLPTLGYSDADPRSDSRLAILLKCFHRELFDDCHTFIELSNDEFWYEAIAGLEETLRTAFGNPPSQDDDIIVEKRSGIDSRLSNEDESSMTSTSASQTQLAVQGVQPVKLVDFAAFLPEDQAGLFKPSPRKPGAHVMHMSGDGKRDVLPGDGFLSPIKIMDSSKDHRSTSVPLLPVDSSGNLKAEVVEKTNLFDSPLPSPNVHAETSAKKVVAFSNDELHSSKHQASPVKKYSAPASANSIAENLDAAKNRTREPIKNRIVTAPGALSTSGQNDKNRGPSLRIYLKRLNPWRLLLIMIPLEDRTVIDFTNPMNPVLPILVFHCDESIMVQNLISSRNIENCQETIVENFCRKSEETPLADLSRNIKRRQSLRSESEYLIEVANISKSRLIPGESVMHTLFDFSNYCEKVIEEQLFTKSFISAVMACLGEKIYVPRSILLETTEFRCEHITIEIGPIIDVLRVTCSHLAARPKRRIRSASDDTLTFRSSISSMPDSLLEPDDILLATKSAWSLGPCSPPTDTNCDSERFEFRHTFENLLKKYGFNRVPMLNDYYFYWPTQEMMELPIELEDLPSRINVAEVNGSVSEYSVEKYGSVRSKKLSGDSTTRSLRKLSSGKRRKTTDSDVEVLDDEFSGVSMPTRSRSPDSGVTLISGSDTSSLIEISNLWPLFIQFSAAVHFPNGQMDTFPLEYIPSCVQDFIEKCSPGVIPANIETALHNVVISIDMYVLTWPLPSHDQFMEPYESHPGSHHPSGNDPERRYAGSVTMNSIEEDDELLKDNFEAINELPEKEQIAVRSLQRGITRMLKTEQILIISRDFDKKPNLKTIKRVIKYVQEELDGVKYDLEEGKVKAYSKDLFIVTNPQEGLSRLSDKFNNMVVDYCKIKRLKPLEIARKASTKSKNSYGNSDTQQEPMYFYTCGVEDLQLFYDTHQDSGGSYELCEKRRESFSIHPQSMESYLSSENHEDDENSSAGIQLLQRQPSGCFQEPIQEEDELTETGTLTRTARDEDEATSISQNLSEYPPIDIEIPLQTLEQNFSMENFKNTPVCHECQEESHYTDKKQLLHDFWLILEVEQVPFMRLNVYFCQRNTSVHDRLFGSLCKMVEDQIRLINQELLLEKMHRLEECDQLLIADQDKLDARLSQPVQFASHAAKYFQHPGEVYEYPSTYSRPMRTSQKYSDEDEPTSADDSESFARSKFPPGHFACDMVWHYWFPIHFRLRPTRNYSGSGGNPDIGFKTLAYALEKFLVRNRNNLFVFKESTGKVAYMRLFSTEEAIMSNISIKTKEWRNEIRSKVESHILLAVFGVRPPGEEIVEKLRDFLQKRLDTSILEEVQRALVKNSQTRLEPKDILFIQNDPKNPVAKFYFTLPAVTQNFLGSIKYYLGQQLCTFCIEPKFRDMSGTNSGGGRVLRRSLADPSVEILPPMFMPYVPEGTHLPVKYQPSFYLLNKPQGIGQRNTGIACLELRLVDWDGRIIENLPEGRLKNETHSLLYPGIVSTNLKDLKTKHNRLYELTKCVQVENFGEKAIPGIQTLVHFIVWQVGDIGLDELQEKLKISVQQAICDLITEFGLLSVSFFDTSTHHFGSPPVLGATTITKGSNESTRNTGLIRQDAITSSIETVPTRPAAITRKRFSSEALSPGPAPIGSVMSAHAGTTTNQGAESRQVMNQKIEERFTFEQTHQHPPHITPYYAYGSTSAINTANMATATAGAANTASSWSMQQPNANQQTSHALDKAIEEGVSTIKQQHLTTHSDSVLFSQPHEQLGTIAVIHHITATSSGPVSTGPTTTGAPSLPPPLNLSPHPKLSPTISTPTSATSGIPMEWLRSDFVSTAAFWFNHVAKETKTHPEMCHSVQKFDFVLDSDGSARKIMQVIYEKFRVAFKKDKVSICQAVFVSGNVHSRRLQKLPSVSTLLEPIVKDYGHVIRNTDDDPIDLALIVFDEQQLVDTIRYGYDPVGRVPESIENICTVGQETFHKFLPCLSPFIPRQRLLYLTVHGEHMTLFLYNYATDFVAWTKEIVERTILWHNARSRLLREIGLHKMGITHLSTLKSTDPRANPYLLLTWMNPEVLVRNDYPVENLNLPDFSKIPRKYAQLLLKLYRYSDPAFVAKNFSTCPFEDQTTQMLTLREDVKSTLNDHRLFKDIHSRILNGDGRITEDNLMRIISRSSEVHYVESPILLFPGWRRKIAAIRNPTVDLSKENRKHSAPTKANQAFALGQENANKTRSKSITTAFWEQPYVAGQTLPQGTASPTGHRSAEDEPCSLKIQYMLVEDYVNYLSLIGFKMLDIKSDKPSVYSTQFSQACVSHPIIWLYHALPGGIVFLHLTFLDPYFSVRTLYWNSSQLLENVPEDLQNSEEVKNLRLIERAKNDLVQKCHVHSFTYDFHLRMVSTYLVGGKQVLFNPGYNTNAFLIDFLQYYGCRPPYARNCIYEESELFPNLRVSGMAIWEHFLGNDQQYGWKVVRLKTLDSNSADEFMLVSKEEKLVFGHNYEFIRVILNDMKGNGRGNEVRLKFYVIMVSLDITHPMIDHNPSGSDHRGGEFTKFETIEKELLKSLNEADTDLETDDEEFNHSNTMSESGRDGSSRQTSGNNPRPLASSSFPTSRNQSDESSTPISTVAEAIPPKAQTPLEQSVFEDETRSRYNSSRLQIQKNPPRRHRKHVSICNENARVNRDKGAIVPPEKVTYVYYLNAYQRKLQRELEDYVKICKEDLLFAVRKADDQCRTDMLWKKLLSCKTNASKKVQSHGMFSGSSSSVKIDSSMDAKTILHAVTNIDMTNDEFDILMSIARLEPMVKEEPRLADLLKKINFGSLCRHLILFYEGEKRCRFFDYSQKHLIITNPSYLDSATMFTFDPKTNEIELIFLFKDKLIDTKSSTSFSRNAIHKQFEEIVSCISCFVWTDLFQRSPNLK